MTGVAPSEDTKHRFLSALGFFESRTGRVSDAGPLLPPAEDIPERLGGVRLVRRLGRGGMGEVWFGRHETLAIDVAVKVLARDVVDGGHLIDEARAAVLLQHPHVVRVLHAGEEDGRFYVVMEYLPCGDAAQLVRREGPLPWRKAVRMALQAAEGLAEAHSLGIVHRDVKPANFLLAADGTVKIADFGLAQRIGYRCAPDGFVHGTPAYMAPEQALGQPATPAADVYALGVSLYQLLTGSKPFQGHNTSRLLHAHQNKPLPDPRKIVADIPALLVDQLKEMTAKDPSLRPADGAAVAKRLRRLAEGDHAESRRGRMPAVAAVVAAGGIVVVGGWLTVVSPGSTPPPAVVAAPVVATTPVVAAAPAADAWRTPARAVFVLTQDVPVEIEAAIDGALRGTGLTIIERQRIERIVGEQSMARGGFVEAGSSVAVGRLVGGHIALIARGGTSGVHCAAVAVETGERVASAVVPEPASMGTVADLVRAVIATLPTRGYIQPDGSGGFRLDIGSAHGVRSHDTFAVYAGTPDQPGDPIAVGRVVSVTRSTADLALMGEAPRGRALAQRREP